MAAACLPRQRGGRARLGAGAAAEAMSFGALSRATMVRCREAGARLVAGADLGLAEARIPCRPRLAGVARNYLSQFVCAGPWRAEEGADGSSSGRAAHAPAKGGTTQVSGPASSSMQSQSASARPRSRTAPFPAIGRATCSREPTTRTWRRWSSAIPASRC